jgi:predicted lipoprotein
LARRRAAYAAAAAADVAALGERLSSAWGPGGDWADWLSRPDDDDSPYDDPSAAADGLMNAALYLDVRVKDRKLGAASSDLLESAFSARSKEHVLANLEGFRLVLLGGETPDQGYGFDDFLVALEEPELGAQMIAAVDEAVAAASAIDGSFEDALAADPGALVPVQDAVRRLTDLIKGPFVTTLKLSPPGEGAGDAD